MMQLKNGFHLMATISRELLPPVPNHNNNQPFSNVSLDVGEVQVGDRDGGDDDESVPVYSLFGGDEEERGGGVEGREGGGGDDGFENLRFLPNEYGFLEVLEDEDDDSDDSSTSSSSSSSSSLEPDNAGLNGSVVVGSSNAMETSDDDNNVSSCVTCGCFAMGTELFDGKHCTYDCAVITRVNERKERMRMVDGEGEVKRRRVGSEEEECSSGDVVVNPFRVNDLMEAIDPEHQSLFCPVKVVEVIGYRVLLKFIGYSDKYNFWVDADSEDVFPVGWTTKYNEEVKKVSTSSSPQQQQQPPYLHFHKPPNFTSWSAYTALNQSCRVAPDDSFPHIDRISEQDLTRAGIRVGMKLEAVDIRSRSLLICVATVSCVLGGRVLVHFDSWDSVYDYWTGGGGGCWGFVYPVGYCLGAGVEITPPHCYQTPSEFDWTEYLKKTGSVPMPQSLFPTTKSLPAFQPGQQVEAIDRRSPRLLRVATVKAVSRYTISLHFNGLDELLDYDVPVCSKEVHEAGWGARTGHPLVCGEGEEGRRGGKRIRDCTNHRVCRSVGSARGGQAVHGKVKECPYYFGGDFGGEGPSTDRVVVFEDKFYDLGGSGGVVDEEEEENDDENEESSPPVAKQPPTQPPEQPHKTVNGYHDHQVIPKRSEILTWSHNEISDLVQGLCSNLPTSQAVADQFRNNLIDGESFLMLTQSDMTEALGIKLGPAVKIFNLIRLIGLNKG